MHPQNSKTHTAEGFKAYYTFEHRLQNPRPYHREQVTTNIELLHPSQYCGVPDKTICEAVATVRDAIACAEATRSPVCVLPLDFQEAFDKISHTYLSTISKSYGFSDIFVERIRQMYENLTSVFQINGMLSDLIPLRCSIRKGCPPTLLSFTLCLNPLIHGLEQQLHGVRIPRQQNKTAVVAYADDISILVTTPDTTIVKDAVQCFERATGAVLNISKSKALAVGTRGTSRMVMDIPYSDEIKVLGFRMTKSLAQPGTASWTRITTLIRNQARDVYCRDLVMAQRIK
jgi:hypothetical protein